MNDRPEMVETGTEANLARLRAGILLAAVVLLAAFAILVSRQPFAVRYTVPVFLFLTTFVLVYLLLLRFRRGLLILLGLSVSFLIVEGVFAYLESRSGYLDGPLQVSEPDGAGPAVMVRHPELVYWMNPNVTGQASKSFRGEVVYENVPFHTDSMGRRACPELETPAPYHALFFGGSFTFGMGATDEQTVPCIFQALSGGEFQAYNFAKNGYGTGQMVSLLESGEYFEAGIQPEGIAVYNFIADHVDRTVGELGKLTSEVVPWGEFRLFRLDPETGELVSYHLPDNPRFASAVRSLQTLRLLSPTARYLIARADLPLAPEEEGLRITAEVILWAKEIYAASYSGDFIVVLWPRVGLDAESEAYFTELLEAGGVRVLEVPELPDGVPAQMLLQDPHPSVEEIRWVAEAIGQEVLRGR